MKGIPYLDVRLSHVTSHFGNPPCVTSGHFGVGAAIRALCGPSREEKRPHEHDPCGVPMRPSRHNKSIWILSP